MYRIITIIASMALLISGCGRDYDTRGMTMQELETFADDTFQDGDYTEAARLYTELMFTYPGATNVDYYIYRMGMSEAGNRLWADALFYFDRVRNEYPRGQWADDATLQTAFVWWDQRRDYRKDLTPVLNCSDQLDIFFDRYPGSDLVDQAQELRSEVNSYLAQRALFTGRFYARRQRYDAALLYLREALNDYGQPDCLPSILIALGDVYASKGNDYTARQFYQRAIDQCDLSETQLIDVQSKLDDL